MIDLPPVAALENVLQAALEQRDFVGVKHALHLIAVQDPQRAKVLFDTITVGLTVAVERQKPAAADFALSCDASVCAGGTLKVGSVVDSADDEATQIGKVLDYAAAQGWQILHRQDPEKTRVYCPNHHRRETAHASR